MLIPLSFPRTKDQYGVSLRIVVTALLFLSFFHYPSSQPLLQGIRLDDTSWLYFFFSLVIAGPFQFTASSLSFYCHPFWPFCLLPLPRRAFHPPCLPWSPPLSFLFLHRLVPAPPCYCGAALTSPLSIPGLPSVFVSLHLSLHCDPDSDGLFLYSESNRRSIPSPSLFSPFAHQHLSQRVRLQFAFPPHSVGNKNLVYFSFPPLFLERQISPLPGIDPLYSRISPSTPPAGRVRIQVTQTLRTVWPRPPTHSHCVSVPVNFSTPPCNTACSFARCVCLLGVLADFVPSSQRLFAHAASFNSLPLSRTPLLRPSPCCFSWVFSLVGIPSPQRRLLTSPHLKTLCPPFSSLLFLLP